MSSQPFSRLARLPSELLLCVAESLPDAGSLSRLIRTCRRMSIELTRTLYRQDITSGLCEALKWSCENDDIPTLARTLDAGASIDHIFRQLGQHASSGAASNPPDRITPLLLALLSRNLRTARFLLDRGADATLPYRGSPLLDWTIYHYAKDPGPEEADELHNLMEMLLEKGANPHYTDDRVCPLGLTMIIPAPLKTMRLLFDYNVDTMGPCRSQGSTRIWEVALRALRGSKSPPHLALQKFRLLLQNCEINRLVDDIGEGILHSLVVRCARNRLRCCNESDYLEVLLEEGVDVNMRSPIYGDSILSRLAGVMNWLAFPQNIPVGRFPSPATSDDTTLCPRRDAFFIAQTLFVRLLKAGSQHTNQGTTHNGSDSLLVSLIRTEWDASEAISTLLQHGADARVVDKDGRGPLHHACMVVNPKIAVVSTLLRFQLDPNMPDDQDRTALHALLGSLGNKQSRKEVYKLLIAHGVDVNARDEDGLTAVELGQQYYDVQWE